MLRRLRSFSTPYFSAIPEDEIIDDEINNNNNNIENFEQKRFNKNTPSCEPKDALSWNGKTKDGTRNFSTDDGYVDVDIPSDDEYESENELNFSLIDPNILRARIIRHLPSEVTTKYGSPIVLTCLTTVLFPVDIEWTLNGTIIEPTIDGRIFFRRPTTIIHFVFND
uniref:Ig-like domain-containing protein n=1 Tax=Clytia hemisphaerica TaxID=252671 RepID=A0A7M5XJ11_9CNID